MLLAEGLATLVGHDPRLITAHMLQRVGYMPSLDDVQKRLDRLAHTAPTGFWLCNRFECHCASTRY